MADQEIMPADLYVQPPSHLKLKAKSSFMRFVRMFPPEFFLECDVPMIDSFIQLNARIVELEAMMPTPEYYITENDAGTESIHPLVKVREMFRREQVMLADYLRISPSARFLALPKDINPDGGPKRVRMVYKYTTDEDVIDADFEEVGDAGD